MDVKIVRSRHRAKTVSAREVDGYLLVQAPAGMSDADLQPIVDRLKKRLQNRQARQSLDNQDLQRLAHKLNQEYFDGTLAWKSISWVTNQEKSRWASCTSSVAWKTPLTTGTATSAVVWPVILTFADVLGV